MELLLIYTQQAVSDKAGCSICVIVAKFLSWSPIFKLNLFYKYIFDLIIINPRGVEPYRGQNLERNVKNCFVKLIKIY